MCLGVMGCTHARSTWSALDPYFSTRARLPMNASDRFSNSVCSFLPDADIGCLYEREIVFAKPHEHGDNGCAAC